MFRAVRLFCSVDSNNSTNIWYNSIKSYSKRHTCSAYDSSGTLINREETGTSLWKRKWHFTASARLQSYYKYCDILERKLRFFSRVLHLYLRTRDTQKIQTSMPPVGFVPTISAGERPRTYALDRAAIGTGTHTHTHTHTHIYIYIYIIHKYAHGPHDKTKRAAVWTNLVSGSQSCSCVRHERIRDSRGIAPPILNLSTRYRISNPGTRWVRCSNGLTAGFGAVKRLSIAPVGSRNTTPLTASP
jgi:hypothetical protein